MGRLNSGWGNKELRWWDEALDNDEIDLNEWAVLDGYEDYSD